MSGFRRFAVYYLPDDTDLATFGASWLGWDVATGSARDQPEARGIARMTAQPRKYGFHGTLKPPFRMAEGTRVEDLARDVAALAANTPAVILETLELAAIGHFLALVPVGETQALSHLAFDCVTHLDAYRALPDEAELARRRTAGLTPRQDDLLARWGYPYVGEEFRFHLTLTGTLETEELHDAQVSLSARLPALPRPFVIGSISLVGEGSDGFFRLIHRYALTG